MSVTATIQELLQGIMDSQYGRDMRQFIHDAIQKCYEEGSAGETDLTARNDIEKINNNIATVEESSTASRSYAKGDYLIYDSNLYVTKSAISSGETFTVGTNIQLITLGDVMKHLEVFEGTVSHSNDSWTTIIGKVLKYGKVCVLTFARDTTQSTQYFAQNTTLIIIGKLPSEFGINSNFQYLNYFGDNMQVFGYAKIAKVNQSNDITADVLITPEGYIRLKMNGTIDAENSYYFQYGYAVFIAE